jgi:alpha-L-rhamnosidase
VGFKAFWDAARHSYVDKIVDGVRCAEMSQLGGALAIVSGLAPKERWARSVDVITDPKRLVVRSWTSGEDGDYSTEKRIKSWRISRSCSPICSKGMPYVWPFI